MTTAPYDPRSGNTPDAKPLDIASMRYQAQAQKQNVTPKRNVTVFLPVGTIVTQSGEEIDVDFTGRAEDGLVPIGSTKPVSTGDGTPLGDGTPIGGGNNLNPDKAKKKSAYDQLFADLNPLGLGDLVNEVLRPLIEDPGVSDEQFTTSLRGSDKYKNRFSANAKRITAGLKPLDEATYLALEDKYQAVMRNYGLPDSYYAKGAFGKQEGFEKFIGSDVSATELEDRIMTAQTRVINANPQVSQALKQFYPDITNGDILAYSLDPKNAIKDIQRKVTAAEIGGAAFAAGLNLGTTPEQIAASRARAEMLQGYGVTQEQAMSGFQTVAESQPRGTQLSQFYNRPTYGQMEAEQEVFNLEGAVAARKKRKEVTGLEKAAFGGQTGLTSGALNRDRAGGY